MSSAGKPRGSHDADVESEADVNQMDDGGVLDQHKETAAVIGRRLRETYGRLLADPVPKKFFDLLDELEKKSIKKDCPGEKNHDDNDASKG